MFRIMLLALALLLATGQGFAQERLGYRALPNGKFELTRDLTVQTRLFGPITLTRGYHSDGSSSPIRDTHGSRIAGFVHDALYSASGHLRFAKGYPRGWTRRQADRAYCELMRRKASRWHARVNCLGVKRGFWIERAWNRLKRKRERRWAKRATRPALGG